MADYSFWARTQSFATYTDANGRTQGVEFFVTADGWVKSLWYRKPTTTSAPPITGAIYEIGTTTPLWSAAFPSSAGVAGWIELVLATPLKVVSGKKYRAAAWVQGGDNVLSGSASYWTTGGLGVNGLSVGGGFLQAPGSATAVGNAQGPYNIGALAYPNTTNTSKANYGVDLTVTDINPTAPSTISWTADLAAGTLAGMGFSLWQRQTDAGVFTNSSTTAPPVVTEFGGRAGPAFQITISDTERRNEVVPNHRDLTTGDSVYFAQAFYLAAGFPLDPTSGFDGYQIIDQIHQAWGNYSPPISFEALEGQLRLTGGYGLSRAPQIGGTEATDPTIYQHEQSLAPLAVGRWNTLVYYVENFSQTPGASKLTVWLNGVAVLTNWTIPPPTMVQGDASGPESYRKVGIYHSDALPGLTLYQAAHAAGPTYASVDPGPVPQTDGGMSLYPFFV